MDRKLSVFFVTCFLGCLGGYGAPGNENWDNRFGLPPGLDGPVMSMATIGKNLYVAGDFKRAGTVEVSGLACWNGQQWSSVPAPGLSGHVYSLASDGKNLFVGGWFVIPSIGATNIAKWTGSRWDRLGDGVRQECGGRVGVFALAMKGSALYAGGAFSQAGSVGATNVALWDGRKWSALGAGIGGTCNDQPYGIVNALAVQGNNLYAGGIFHNSGALRMTNIALWDGRSWNDVGGGLIGGSSFGYVHDGVVEEYSGNVLALHATPNGIYVGGTFTLTGTIFAEKIALWTGKTWNALDGGIRFDGYVAAITSWQQDIIVGGSFNWAGSVPAQNIARWNGLAWGEVGAGFRGPVLALSQVQGKTLYAGGDFGLCGQTQAAFIARLSGDQWAPLQPGTGNAVIGFVAGLAAAHGRAYLFGNVSSAGSLPVQSLVEWDGSAWGNLGGGLPVFAQQGVVARSNLYVQGSFQLPAIGATNVACWNGASWSGLPRVDQLGLNALNRVAAIAGDDERLFLALHPMAQEPASVFRWNGSQWAGLGILSGDVHGMTASDGNLYVFGSFDQIGGVAATNIARWNGQSWQPLGRGLAELGQNYSVQVAAAAGGRLYVSGAGDGGACLAVWNGTSWRCLLQGAFLSINSLAATRDWLYVGGYFTEIGGVPANYIARTDGTNWYSLGSGLNGPPDFQGLVAEENRVYVKGLFSTAGGKSSYRFGIWHEP